MAGRKISRANMARIQQIADHAYAMGAKPPTADTSPIGKADMSLTDQMQAVASAVYGSSTSAEYPYVEAVFDGYVIIELGNSYYRADYTMDDAGAVTLAARDAWVEVEEVWQPVSATAKAGLLNLGDASSPVYASLKAVGDRQIEVKIAYGGHRGGKDSHGEYFSSKTDFDTENFPAPPLLYYHGYDESGRKMARPVVTGKCISRRAGGDAHYLTYQLKNGKYPDLQWSSAQKGACVVSPGTVGHLIRKAADGELLYWPLAEVSAWDYDGKRAPANMHSVAAPVLKAAYLEAGLRLPSLLDTPSPEAAGDAASASSDTPPDVSPDEAARFITTQVVSALLAKNTRT